MTASSSSLDKRGLHGTKHETVWLAGRRAASYFLSMAFPFGPSKFHPVDEHGKFVVDDPWGMRKSVFPLLHQTNETGSMRGWGTAFRIDPYGTAVTAHHVVEDFFEVVQKAGTTELRYRAERKLFGLQGMGLVCGQVGIAAEFWMPVDLVQIHVFEKPDYSLTPEFRSLDETATLHMPTKGKEQPRPLPVKIRSWPKVGDRVLALGFADLKVNEPMDQAKAFFLTENLYGSIGKITEVRPADPQSMRPWPTLIVDANWLPGMSGGPVFNEAGEIIGLVSTGLHGSYSTAVWFGGWDLHERVFPQLDPSNPRMLLGWAAMQNGEVKAFGFHKLEVLVRAVELGIENVEWISINWENGGFMKKNNQTHPIQGA